MILIIGDSHARMIARGLERAREKDPGAFPEYRADMLGIGRTFLRSFHTQNEGSIRLTEPTHLKQFEKISGCRELSSSTTPVVFLSLGLHGIAFYNSSISHLSKITQSRAWKNFLTDKIFELAVLRFNFHILKFAKALRDADIQTTIISAPYLTSRFYGAKEKRPFSPSELVDIDRAYRSIMLAAYAKANIPVILPPEDSHENYVMKDEYCRSLDGDYHGNAEYGEAVLWQIRSYLQQGAALDRREA